MKKVIIIIFVSIIITSSSHATTAYSAFIQFLNTTKYYSFLGFKVSSMISDGYYVGENAFPQNVTSNKEYIIGIPPGSYAMISFNNTTGYYSKKEVDFQYRWLANSGYYPDRNLRYDVSQDTIILSMHDNGEVLKKDERSGDAGSFFSGFVGTDQYFASSGIKYLGTWTNKSDAVEAMVNDRIDEFDELLNSNMSPEERTRFDSQRKLMMTAIFKALEELYKLIWPSQYRAYTVMLASGHHYEPDETKCAIKNCLIKSNNSSILGSSVGSWDKGINAMKEYWDTLPNDWAKESAHWN
jgi:hypothetical protein